MLTSQTTSCTSSLLFQFAGFRRLPISEQIMVIQMTMFPIVLCNLSSKYDVNTGNYCYFNMHKEEEALILCNFPSFTCLLPHFHRMGKLLNQRPYSLVAIGFLCALFLVKECKYPVSLNIGVPYSQTVIQTCFKDHQCV